MSQKTIELNVGRQEMGTDGRPVSSPIAPFDIPEPKLGTEHMLINIGPQHPATHGVLRLICELEGWYLPHAAKGRVRQAQTAIRSDNGYPFKQVIEGFALHRDQRVIIPLKRQRVRHVLP